MDLPFAELRFVRTVAGRWAVAVGAFLLAVIARMLLDFVAPDQLPFITFLPAVLVVALLCRPLQSGTVLLAAAVFGTYWTRPPSGESFSPIWIAAFVAAGAIDIGLIELFKLANRRLRQQDEMLRLLNRELRHRLKNMSAVIISIVSHAIREGGDPDAIMESVRGRVNAIAAASGRLSTPDKGGTDIGTLIESIVAPLAPSRDRLIVRGDDPIVIEQQDTTGFALVLHELATNALKYGGWSVDGGDVRIAWSPLGKGTAFEWTETVPHALEQTTHAGFGTRLIRQGVPRATVAHELRPGGLYCRIELPSVEEVGGQPKGVAGVSLAL